MTTYRYYDTNRVVDEGELVITTKASEREFYDVCSSVDKRRCVLAGVLVTGDCRLCAMVIKGRKDLGVFLEGVSHTLFFKPAGGIVYKLPIEKEKGLKASYEKASISRNVHDVKLILDNARMELSGGIISSLSFAPRGKL